MKTSLVCLGCLVISLAACSPSPTGAPAGQTATPGPSAPSSANPEQTQTAASPAAPLSESERLDIAREIATYQTSAAPSRDTLYNLLPGGRADAERCEQFQTETRRQRCLDRVAENQAQQADIRERVASAIDSGEADLVGLIANAYTDEELIGIRDFYRSPAGQAMLEKGPKITVAYMAKTMERIRSSMPELDRPVPNTP